MWTTKAAADLPLTYVNLKKDKETNEILGIQLVYGASELIGPWLETWNAGDEP